MMANLSFNGRGSLQEDGELKANMVRRQLIFITAILISQPSFYIRLLEVESE